MRKCVLILCLAIMSIAPNSIFGNSYVQTEKIIFKMYLYYNDPNMEHVHPRIPSAPISVSLSGHTFTFPAHLAGETIEIMSGDTVVYTSVIGEDGTVTAPDDLTGEYTLVLYAGDKVYSAEVEL